MESLQLQITTELDRIREHIQQRLQSVEANFKLAIDAKDGVWSEVSDQVHALHQELTELMTIIHDQRSSPTTANKSLVFNASQLPTNQSSTPKNVDLNCTPFNLSSSDTTIVTPISSFPTFSGKLSDRPRQFQNSRQ
ncbi:unnamed protein product [Adineta steineri]|uniref:Uncharacterized protein n=1 Tax=Adineta steineri TaxID=433720 RepID=A0A819XZS7_9BILA|nr:unnamed protein product [Adineta steineri]CAF4149965.1 unnamed protein product [Adineta steineri]